MFKINFSFLKLFFPKKLFFKEFVIPKIKLNTKICKNVLIKFDIYSKTNKINKSTFLLINSKNKKIYSKQLFFSRTQKISMLIDSTAFLENTKIKIYFPNNKYTKDISIKHLNIYYENKFISQEQNFSNINKYIPKIEWFLDNKLKKITGKCIFGCFFIKAKSINSKINIEIDKNNKKYEILEKFFLIYPLHHIGLNMISKGHFKKFNEKKINKTTSQTTHQENFIAYSGGVDSSALSAIFPEYIKFTYIRSYSSYNRSDGKKVNVNNSPYDLNNPALSTDLLIYGDIEKFFTNIGFIRNKFPSLLFYGYLLIPFINLKKISINYGFEINEIFFSRDIKFRDLNKQFHLKHNTDLNIDFSSEEFNLINLILSEIGVDLKIPLAGNSEAINAKIIKMMKISYSSCPYFENNKSCNNCIKCFRKNLLFHNFENLKKYKKNYIPLVEKLFSYMPLSAMQSVNNLPTIKNPKNFINIFNKYYEKALLKLGNSEQQKKLSDIYRKINVKKISKNNELIIKNIEIKKVNKLIRKFKNNLIKKILV